VKRVLYEELDYPGDGLYYLGEAPFTGVVYSGFEDEPDSQQEFRNGLAWGFGMTWHGSGAVASDCQFEGGVYHGLRREFQEDGGLALLEVYEHGVCLWRRRWDEAGRLLEDYALSETSGNWQTASILRRAFVRDNRQPRQ
jgi:hypothetical protein